MITSKFLRNLEVKLSDSEKLKTPRKISSLEHDIETKLNETKHVEDKHRG